MITFLKRARPGLAALASTVLLAAAAVVAGPAAPAQAAGSCRLVAPTRVSISSPYRPVILRLSTDCAARQVDGWAAWDAYHPTQGLQDIAFFDVGTTEDIWDIYDDQTPLGTLTWRAAYCFDGAFDPCSQDTPKTEVRLGGWAGLTAVRSGSSVTINTSSARYAYSLDKFVPWGGIRGTVQTRTSSASPWVGLKWVYPGATGKTTFRYTTTSARDYRVVFPATTYIWDATSNTVRK